LVFNPGTDTVKLFYARRVVRFSPQAGYIGYILV